MSSATPSLKPIDLNKTYMQTRTLWRHRANTSDEKHVSRAQWLRKDRAFK